MKHGFVQVIIDLFKGLHADTVTFTKGFVVGTVGSGFILLNAKIGNYDMAFAVIIKLCYIGATGLLTGITVTVGKMIVQAVTKWWKSRKKKQEPEQKHNFSKNGKDDQKTA